MDIQHPINSTILLPAWLNHTEPFQDGSTTINHRISPDLTISAVPWKYLGNCHTYTGASASGDAAGGTNMELVVVVQLAMVGPTFAPAVQFAYGKPSIWG